MADQVSRSRDQFRLKRLSGLSGIVIEKKLEISGLE